MIWEMIVMLKCARINICTFGRGARGKGEWVES